MDRRGISHCFYLVELVQIGGEIPLSSIKNGRDQVLKSGHHETCEGDGVGTYNRSPYPYYGRVW